MPLQPGDKLGPYEILSLLGKGGMGEVYKARDTRLDRMVALKVSAAQFSERFEREAKAIAALNHPNICTLHDVGPNYLVMEYIEGTPLKGPLPLDQALKYAAQICDALDAAHKKGIIHRDLKPANILVTKAGIKLLDFGLAKLASANSGLAPKPDDATLTMALTGKNEIVGTLYYMSPEQLQAQANGQDIDGRSDIFSFGLVLYEMLTGKRAFEGSSPASVIAAIMERPAPSIAEIAPASLDRALKICLAKVPDDRWQTARDLKREIEWIASASTEVAAARPAARLRLFPWITAAVLAALAVLAYRATRPAELKPLMRLDVNLGPDALPGPVTISPDGTRIVFSIRGAGSQPLLATRLLDQAAIAPLPGTENGNGVFFSPDGQWIGFGADGALKKVSLHGGAPVTLAETDAFLGASWGENGDIVTGAFTGGLHSISASGGRPQLVTSLGKQEVTHVSPQVLPGGNSVLFTATKTTGDGADLQVVSLTSHAVKTILSGGFFGRYLPTDGTTGHLVYVRQGALYAVAFDPVRLEVRGRPEQILDDVSGMVPFDFSRNGTFVYQAVIADDQKWPIVWMDSSGKTEPLVPTPGKYSDPRVSPDGKRLALSADAGKGQGIFVYDTRKGALSRLTFAGRESQSPVWSRDGEHLVFESHNADGSRLNWVRADGSGETRVLLESKSLAFPSGFSPDGRRLAYHRLEHEGNIDIWTLPIDTSDPERPNPGQPSTFLQMPGSAASLVFSPDGRYVAYMSSESGLGEIYVRPAPGPDGKPGPGKWQVSTGGGFYPEWSPNGRELFYLGMDSHIMVTDYTTTGRSFSSSRPRVWSPRRIRRVGAALTFGLAPDGKRFAVFPMSETTAEDKAPAHVTFLLNFFDELRRKVPVGK